MEGARRAAFESWLSLNAENRRAWERVERSWGAIDAVGIDTLRRALGPSAGTSAHDRRTGRSHPRWPIGLALAAGLGAVITIPSVLLHGGISPFSSSAVPATASAFGTGPIHRYRSGKGERPKITLADGSILTLDGGTEILVRIAGDRRDVWLRRGRGMFDVAKDKSRPFVVRAADRQVTALGTSFSVRADPGAIKVVLAEGRVAIARVGSGAAKTDAVLHPGQMFAGTTGEAGKVQAADLSSELSWRQGLITLNDVPLAEAAREVNRYNDRLIELRGPDTPGLRVSGVFQVGAPDHFADLISQTLPVTVRHERSGIVVEATAAAR